MILVGRARERAALVEAVASARQGRSAALVVTGDPGIGKSALLAEALAGAPDLRTVRVSGVEAESRAPFSTLHQVVHPFLAGLDDLPGPQRDALATACALASGPPADPYLVGLAALSLLAGAAADQPVLVVIDDAHWLDVASLTAVGFLGRRLDADGVTLVLARRTSHPLAALDGLPVLALDGLDHDSAIELLRAAVDGPLSRSVADAVVVATGGNPLAITELGTTLTGQQLVGGAPLPRALPLNEQIEAHYRSLTLALPAATQLWLLVAAAEPSGDARNVARASALLGLPADAADAAEAARVVAAEPDITFRHPLVRTAVYAGATGAERRRAHDALAAAAEQQGATDLWAWHAAAGVTGRDEAVAAALAGSADRARDRAGSAAAIDLMVRAAALTPDPAVRARRLLRAAEDALSSGAGAQAQTLLDEADGSIRAGPDRGRVEALRAEIAMVTGGPGAFALAPAAYFAAFQASREAEPERAARSLLRACDMVVLAEHLIAETSAAELMGAVDPRCADRDGATVVDLLLAAVRALALEPYAVAVAPVRRAIDALLDPACPDAEVLAWFQIGTSCCTMLLDDQARIRLLRRAAGVARRTGALRELDVILFCQSMGETNLGRLDRADAYAAEGHQLRAVLGATAEQWDIYRHPEQMAWRADDPNIGEILQATQAGATALGNGAIVSIAQIAEVTLALGEGRYQEASALASVLAARGEIPIHTRVLPEAVEAASRAGDPALASRWNAELGARAAASGTPWARGLALRSSALVADDAEAEAAYREAIEVLDATEARADAARARLLYGEWLRRQGRRTDARGALREAHDRFSDMGATAFAERARGELAATGERARRRTVETAGLLTPQEQQIADLAARGETNAEIGERLYISARTVDYHLRKVYRKLGVTSRRELRPPDR